ncbi:MAG: hypothetical protein JWN02_1298 [Acidobacteria bacterium]|nr:hypothetical protein [Acidobacteriota bacterium]
MTRTEEEIAVALVAIPMAVEVYRRASFLGMTVGARAPTVVVSPPPLAERVLLNVRDAAKLLGITPNALKLRMQVRQVPGLVRIGRRVWFHREKLVAGYGKVAK